MAGRSRFTMFLFFFGAFGLAFGLLYSFAQSDSSFKLRVDVELTTTEVVVMDKKGNPVHDLKKEDFELYEDGKKQEILSIDEVSAEPGISSIGMNPVSETALHRGKTVLIIFDDSSISPEYSKTSRLSAQKFVQDHMRPQDLFAVAAYSMSMKILQNFTSDRQEVLQAIGQARGAVSAGGSGYFENLLRSLDNINHSIAPIKGPKTVLIYWQPLSGSGSGAEIIQTLYRNTLGSARKADAVIYTIDPGMFRSQPPPGLSLRSLSAESGGDFIDRDIEQELEKLDQRISNYYILGFRSSNTKHDGAFRKIEVRTESKGVTVKHESGYQDRRPIDALASAKREQTLLTAVASPGTTTQLPIIFRPAYFYNSSGSARVLIAARIRMEKTVFRKKGAQLGTDLNIMGVAYAEDGSTAARFSETLPVTFGKEKETEFRNQPLVYRNYFKLRPGKYRLKLAVSDESDNLGSMEQFLEVPAFPERGFAASSLVIAEQTSRLPDLIRNVQTQLLDESDPLLCPGIQIEPSVENRLPVGSAIPLMFRIYNLPGSDPLSLTARAKLLDEKGKAYASGLIPLKEVMAPAAKGESVVVLSLSFPNIPPGKYRFIMETGEPPSTVAVTLQTDLEFTK
jgi:VWFA-related protein